LRYEKKKGVVHLIDVNLDYLMIYPLENEFNPLHNSALGAFIDRGVGDGT